jgi:hypothetical protein
MTDLGCAELQQPIPRAVSKGIAEPFCDSVLKRGRFLGVLKQEASMRRETQLKMRHGS